MAESKKEEKLVFRVEDGWLQIEKRFLEKLTIYISNTEEAYIDDFFDKSGMNAQRVSRIINDKNRATVFDEKTAMFINDYSEYFAINRYKEYYIDGHSYGVMKFEN